MIRATRAAAPLSVAAVPLGAAAVLAAGLIVARTGHPQLAPLPSAARGVVVGLLLFWISGDAVALWLAPRAWGAPAGLCALPIGAALSGLVLTALGLAHVPLAVSAWLLLAAGLGCALFVRLRRRRARRAREPGPGDPTGDGPADPTGEGLAGPQVDAAARWSRAAWVTASVVLVVVALAPAWRHGLTTIYGQNPDAHQVAGIAVLFQHVPPTATDVALPIDTVPPAWRFRYPIFYPLAAVAQIGHLDPITAFPALAALLLACLALGFGALAVLCLDAPGWSGPLIGAACALTAASLHSVWHPYWNQLWGMAMFPWALVFGWRAVRDPGRGPAALFVLTLIELGLAYPLALPYPVLIVGALALAHERWRSASQVLRSRSWLAIVLALLVLAPAVAGAALKLAQGVRQLFSSSSGLWGGDIVHALPLGTFVGTGGGLAAALAVLTVAAVALTGIPGRGRPVVGGVARRDAAALGVCLGLLCLLDLRFRLDAQGAYMDFKHLSFLGPLVLTVAGAGLARWVAAGRGPVIAVALALSLGWAAAALPLAHREMLANQTQVDPELFAVRRWAATLPRGASVRVDVPPSGLQLWAVYMLGSHPVDAPRPLLYTTYAHAVYGLRADYSLSQRYVAGANGVVRPAGRPLFAVGPPLESNDHFQLWRIAWPRRLDAIPSAASQALVEP